MFYPENETTAKCLVQIRNRMMQLEHDRNRLLILATKYCPQEHHDWKELLELASRAQDWNKT